MTLCLIKERSQAVATSRAQEIWGRKVTHSTSIPLCSAIPSYPPQSLASGLSSEIDEGLAVVMIISASLGRCHFHVLQGWIFSGGSSNPQTISILHINGKTNNQIYCLESI